MYMPISPLLWRCVKLLPLDVTGEMTDYEFISRLCRKVNELIQSNNDTGNQLQLTINQVNQIAAEVAGIQAELEKVKNGDYVSLYLDSIKSWIDANLQELVARTVKYVFFGLTDDGYFAAYVPDSWDFIRFDTPMDYSSDDYGHLLLYY